MTRSPRGPALVASHGGNRIAAFSDLHLSPALFLSIAAATASIGLLSSGVGLQAGFEGFGTVTIGAINAGYYLGFLIGALTAPRVVERVGHIRAYAAFASLASGAVLLHLVTLNPLMWAVIRTVAGAMIAGGFVVAESWLNTGATNGTRGRLLAAYGAVSMASLGLGQLLLSVVGSDLVMLFVVCSLLLSLAVVPLTLAREHDPVPAGPLSLSHRHLATRVPMGVVGVFVGGLLQGAMLGMGAVYGTAAGLSVTEIAGFMAAGVAGGFVAEWPIGWLSDQTDRRRVIAATAFAASLIAAIATQAESALMVMVAMGAVGALTFPIYPLAVAHVNDHLETNEMVPAASRLLALGGVGSMFGPIAAALSMRFWGDTGFFTTLAMASGGLAILSAILIASSRRPKTTRPQRAYASIHSTATAAVAALHPHHPRPTGTETAPA